MSDNMHISCATCGKELDTEDIVVALTWIENHGGGKCDKETDDE